MPKKTSKKAKTGKKRAAEPTSRETGLPQAAEASARPDYGGIPDMDLKKNLGCG
jgi:hypothetical protein